MRAQQGDQEAWACLFEGQFDAVYAFCLQLTSGDNHAAEDITQETFMIAARRIHRFDPDQGQLRAWFFGIARNRYQKWSTSRARRLQRQQRHQQRLQSPGPEDHSLVLEVLERLEMSDRDLLRAKYLDGQGVRDIAQAHQITEHAAESRLRRARQRFAQAYEQRINLT